MEHSFIKNPILTFYTVRLYTDGYVTFYLQVAGKTGDSNVKRCRKLSHQILYYMPYSIRKIRNRPCVKVFNIKTKRVFSKSTTRENAKKQLRLLNAVHYNKNFITKPTKNQGKPNECTKTTKTRTNKRNKTQKRNKK